MAWEWRSAPRGGARDDAHAVVDALSMAITAAAAVSIRVAMLEGRRLHGHVPRCAADAALRGDMAELCI